MSKFRGLRLIAAVAAAGALALTGCAAQPSDTTPSGAPSSGAPTGPIVIGSQAYYSNEIIAEIYAQALEGAGYTVTRDFNIGQRDAYIPSLESGEIQLFPEYTGNLLQFYKPDATATSPDDVYAALKTALPSGLTVLDQSPATDQDSYNVTKATADQYGLKTIADLSKVPNLVLGGAPELEQRPYGPTGLKSVYGVDTQFQATGDTTVDSLVAGTITFADVYSADPSIQTDGLVTLEDPKGLFLSSNVVPLVNATIADEIAPTINAVSAKLTPAGLVALDVESTVDQKSSADIAKEWLTSVGLD